MKRLTISLRQSSPVRACAFLYKRICRFYERRQSACLAVLVLIALIIALETGATYIAWFVASFASFLLAFFMRRKPFCRLIVFVFFALAIAGYGAYENRPRSVIFPESGVLCGTLSRDAKYEEDKNRTPLVLSEYTIDGIAYDGKIYVYLYGYREGAEFTYGQKLTLTDADIWLPDGQTNPYGFDFRQYLKRNGIFLCASGSVFDAQTEMGERNLKSALFGFKKVIGSWIDDMYPEQSDVMRALLIGDKSSITDDTYDDFRISGIAHLIALSGLHVSCIALVFEKLLMAFFLPKRARYVFTLAILILYAVMTGMSASILRAVIMYACLCLSRLFGYPSDLLTRLSQAFLIQVLMNPLMIQDTGFQLSYASILAVALIGDMLNVRLLALGVSPWKRKLIEPCISGAAIQVGTLPLLCNAFYSVPVLSIPVNLLAVPMGLASVYAGAASVIAYAVFPGAGRLIAFIPEAIWMCIRGAAAWVADLSFAVLSTRAWPALFILLYFACLVIASPYIEPGKRARRTCAILLPLIAIGAMFLPLHINTGLCVTFLDAGYADSAVVDAKGKAYVVDCGKNNDISADYLTASGANVKAIFISHPDSDHAGGLPELLKRYPRATVYLPACWEALNVGEEAMEALEGAHVSYLAAGDEVKLADHIKADVLWPPEGYVPKADNDGSLVLNIVYNDRSVMFTGDITDKYDSEIDADCDVLKVSHHGSKYATTEEFLSHATPDFAVISVSGNGYGHPAPDTLERLMRVGAQVFRTDESGAVTVDVDRAGDICVSTYLP